MVLHAAAEDGALPESEAMDLFLLVLGLNIVEEIPAFLLDLTPLSHTLLQ